MYDTFAVEVRSFERQLIKHRVGESISKRKHDLKYVYADCKGPVPQQVDTLSQRQEAEVEEVHEDECAVTFVHPIQFDESLPVVIDGRPRVIIMGDGDKLWLDNVEGVSGGALCSQERIYSSDQEILHEFRKVWEPRWNKMTHVQPGQWDQILAFIEATMRPVTWKFGEWHQEEVLLALARGKKNRAGIGPDGVSKQDLVSIPDAGRAPLATMFRKTEQGMKWPAQDHHRLRHELG